MLIANRGEIAIRVTRACRELDMQSVAVFSEPDRASAHVLIADEAVCIGPAAPSQSYLNIDAILDAAKQTGADAIHPGYGFLAENAAFAAAVEKAGLVFVGPPAKVIEEMGSKIASRAIMTKAGVPVVPGSEKGSNDPKQIVKDAAAIEGALFVKASAGGGGKGMRLVEKRADLEAAARAAIGEAKSAFGDDTVYLEKRIDHPRHIEFQVLADTHGNTVHLFERECSIQRRHQKLLEETPSPALTPDLRAKMGEAAVAAAEAVGYAGAGTIEFMLDGDNFYFLEMNTRIQVEHPITEETTGVDLVAWQLRVAGGEKLSFKREDLCQNGHAIECRIYAEDEAHNFMPSCGVITVLHEPAGPGVRNDSGVYEGWEVSPHYDPILSKLVAHGQTRELARQRMLRALDEYVVHGVKTSIDLHKRLLTHPKFIAGDIDTSFIEDNASDLLGPTATEAPDDAYVAAALAQELGFLASRGKRVAGSDAAQAGDAIWRRIGNWQVGDRR